jgi:hypothetical protein
MATDIEIGVRKLGDETVGRQMLQANPPNFGPSSGATIPRIHSDPKDKTVFERFLQNLIAALGAPEF